MKRQQWMRLITLIAILATICGLMTGCNGGEVTGSTPSTTAVIEKVTTEDGEVAATDEATNTDQAALNKKIETLLGELDLAPIVGLEDLCRQDLQYYLLEAWDGTIRSTTIDDYEITRTVHARTYTCSITNLTAGGSTATTISIDYVGELQTLANIYDEHAFTMVTNNAGLVEQWSLLERQDVWQVPMGTTGTTVYIIETLEEYGFEDQVAIALVIDSNDQLHSYYLMRGGKVVDTLV